MRQPSASASIVDAGVLDAPVLASLYQAVLDDGAWTEAAIAHLLESGGGFALLASGRAYGEIMPQGFGLGRVTVDEAELLAIGVLPDARRMGLGNRLVEAMSAAAHRFGASRLFLEVRNNNSGALALYGKAGFQLVGCRPAYYHGPMGNITDANILAKEV